MLGSKRWAQYFNLTSLCRLKYIRFVFLFRNYLSTLFEIWFQSIFWWKQSVIMTKRENRDIWMFLLIFHIAMNKFIFWSLWYGYKCVVKKYTKRKLYSFLLNDECYYIRRCQVLHHKSLKINTSLGYLLLLALLFLFPTVSCLLWLSYMFLLQF